MFNTDNDNDVKEKGEIESLQTLVEPLGFRTVRPYALEQKF